MELMGLNGKIVVLRGMQYYLPQTISAHKMEADHRHGDIALAVELRISKVGGQAQLPPADTQPPLDRNALVLEDIPPRQPPERGFQHCNIPY